LTIEAVVFDFGGVFTASPFTGIHAWHVEKGLDPALGVRAVFGPYDQDTDHPWHQLERGEIALLAAAEQIKAVAAEQGLDIELSEMFGSMGGSSIRADMVDKVLELRAEG
jgi:putative hydrolase of the HAD superfamily